MRAGKVLHEDAGFRGAHRSREQREERARTDRGAELVAEHDAHADRRQRAPGERSRGDPFEAVPRREDQRDERNEGERESSDRGRRRDEAPVPEGIRPAEGEEAERDRAHERAATWERDAARERVAQEEERGDPEAEGGAFERRQLTVAEAHGDEVDAAEKHAHGERDERPAVGPHRRLI